MKILALSLLLSLPGVSSGGVINGFADGQYSGEGYWHDTQGNQGQYTALTEFLGNEVLLTYRWKDIETKLRLSYVFRGEGLFDVWFSDELIGSGTCGPTQCHYEAVIYGIRFGEDLVLSEGSLSKSGYKEVGDVTIYWNESLYLLEDPEESPGLPVEGPNPPVPADDPWPPVEQTDPWAPIEQTDPSWPGSGELDGGSQGQGA